MLLTFLFRVSALARVWPQPCNGTSLAMPLVVMLVGATMLREMRGIAAASLLSTIRALMSYRIKLQDQENFNDPAIPVVGIVIYFIAWYGLTISPRRLGSLRSVFR